MSRREEWEAFVAQARDGASLEAVIGEDTIVQGNGLAICPLHDDHDPSLHIFDSTAWYCHGCHLGGDVFNYVMHRHRLTFKEAVLWCAKKIGLTWSPSGAQDDPDFERELQEISVRRRIQTVLTEAAGFMCRTRSKQITRLIEEQYGFDTATQDRFMIGWADPDTLYYWLHEELEYTHEQLLETGLFVPMRNGEIESFFTDRIVFPYVVGHQVVYMIGRRVENRTADDSWEQGKYKKLLTHGSKHEYVSPTISNEWFYGEDDTRGAVPLLVITEGVTDCIALRMIGYRSTSPVTTQFRNKDIPKLVEKTRRVDRVLICNDNETNRRGENPGLEGALKTASALFKAGRDVRLAQLPRPEGICKIDVADFVKQKMTEARANGHTDPRRYAKDELDKVFAGARSYPAFLIEAIEKDIDPTELSQKLKPIFELMGTCPPLEREGYVQMIAKRFKLRVAVVREGVTPHIVEAEQRDQKDDQSESSGNGEGYEAEDRIRGQLFEDATHYYVRGRHADEIISSFILIPRQIVKHETGTIIDCMVRARGVTKDFRHPFPMSAFRNKRDFIRTFEHPAMMWMGNDDNVMNLLSMLRTHEMATQVGTTTLGYHETDEGARWVVKDLVFGPDGPVPDSGIMYVDTRSALSSRLHYEFPKDEELRVLATEAFPRLLAVNESRIMLPTIGWWFATVFKPQVMEKMGHFPLLLIHGTQGSGKTSLMRDVFWPLFGVHKNRDPFSCTDTPFSMISNIASTNAHVVLLDEYRPSDMGRIRLEHIHRVARRVYNCEVEMRGRSDQTVSQYRLQSAVCIAGETRPDGDPALLERLICVNPDKNALTEERQKIFAELTALKLHQLAGPIVQYALRQNINELLVKSAETTDALLREVDRNVPIRCYDNLQLMVLGLTFFEHIAKELNIELPEVDYVEAFRSAIDELLEGDGSTVKDAWDEFFEQCSVYAHLGILRDEVHYSLHDGLNFMYLPACHKVYLDERKRAGLGDATNGLRALRKIIREKITGGESYIIDASVRHKVGDHMLRCIAIDQARIPQSLDAEPFPANAAHGHKIPLDNDWTEANEEHNGRDGYGIN